MSGPLAGGPAEPRRSFASDNNSGIHPEVLAAISRVNPGHVPGYGADPFTEQALDRLRGLFGAETEPFLVLGGTAANVLALAALTRPYHAVLCAESAHLHTSECGALERFAGCKLLTVPSPDGKLIPEGIQGRLQGFGDPHSVQPRVVSITQATEVGTVYSPEEVRRIAGLAHSHGLLLHVDGARLANAAASLDVPLAALTTEAGVDVWSFGGTKNGLMCGEVVVFARRDLAEGFPYVRMQGMQLASKMRFVAAQFDALLTGDLWLRNARHSNRMARLLADELAGLRGVTLSQPVQANGVFARVPPWLIPPLRRRYYFYEWDASTAEVRWMCSWDTTEEDVRGFAACIRELLAAGPP